jgi:hypothetical protein
VLSDKTLEIPSLLRATTICQFIRLLLAFHAW